MNKAQLDGCTGFQPLTLPFPLYTVNRLYFNQSRVIVENTDKKERNSYYML